MAIQQIDNYGDLKEAIAEWLSRTDLTARIPTFIYLAERKIFRRYRAPNNEKTVTYALRENAEYDSLGSGNSNNELELTDRLDLPSDYIETLTLQANKRPLRRISLTELHQKEYENSGETGPIKYFARERGKMRFWPFPDGDTNIRWIYYCDLSGALVEDDDDNDVLRVAPDLYLYGSLLQAQPFLKPEDDEWQLVPMWKEFYDEGFAEIEFQRDEDERSGSNVQIKSAY